MALKDAVGVVTGHVEASPQGSANCDKQGVVALAKLFERHVVAQFRVEFNVDTQVEDCLDFGGQQSPVETILGNAEQHHATQNPGRFVDRDLVPMAAQIMGG